MKNHCRFLRVPALCACMAWLGVMSASAVPEVSTAVASQRMDGSQIVDITYQMAGATAETTVSLQISTDDGVRWLIKPAPANLSGDIGSVTTDGAKAIEYNANADMPRTSSSISRAKVIANDVLTIMLPGDVPMELILIPAGTFTMGSPAGERSRNSVEAQFSVQLTSPFSMGRTEVTQKQWLAVMGSWPETAPSIEYGLGDNYPAYYVSWNDAQNFVTAINAHIASTGQGPAVVRLPTEAEWEYSCRSGTTTRFSFGDSLEVADFCLGSVERTDNMWFCWNSSKSNVVGQKLANPFGLCDMHGNVYEWCQDRYDTYPTSPPVRLNPTGPTSGSLRVIRSGGWGAYAGNCRSAQRFFGTPADRSANIGFRVLAVR